MIGSQTELHSEEIMQIIANIMEIETGSKPNDKEVTYALGLSQAQYTNNTTRNNLYYKKRSQIIERRITLFREVNSRVRYYTLHLATTLFGEYMLIKENGSVQNKRPIRVVKEYFKTLTQAMRSYRVKLLEKINKGYLLDLKEIAQRESR